MIHLFEVIFSIFWAMQTKRPWTQPTDFFVYPLRPPAFYF